MDDEFVEALAAHFDRERESDGATLRLRVGTVTAINAGDVGLVDIIVGGTELDLNDPLPPTPVYKDVPTLKAVAVGDVVFWIQTREGSGLVLGPKHS